MGRLGCPVLCGRDLEQQVLRAALLDAADGRGSLVWLTGPPGIGKSRLVRELAEEAERAGVPVQVGRAVPEGGASPFLPLTRALLPAVRSWRDAEEGRSLERVPELAPWRGALAAVLPSPGGLSQERTEATASAEVSAAVRGEAVAVLVRTLAERAGLVVVLEDLHWADPDTLAVLDVLADRARDGRALWLLTTRDEPEAAASALARRCADRRGARTLRLTALADHDVERMALACSPDAARADLERVRRCAEGVPFLVEELLTAPGVPESFAATVAERLATLSPETRRVLDAAAVLGRNFDWRLLAAITRLPESEVATALQLGADCGLLTVTEGPEAGFRFRHALTREALLGTLLPPVRGPLATAALDAVLAAHPDTRPDAQGRGDEPRDDTGWREVAADLARQAGDLRRAGALLTGAGRSALARGALDTAAGALREAHALLAGTTPWSRQAAEPTLLLVRALALAGRIDETLDVGDQAVAELRAAGEAAERLCAEILLTMAQAAVSAARWEEVDRRLRLAEPLRRHLRDPALDAHATVLAAELALARDDTAGARRLATQVLATGRAEPECACQAHEVLGRIDRPVDLDAAAHAFEQALVVATAARLPVWRLRALHELGTIDLYQRLDTGRLEEAQRLALRLGALGTAAVLDIQIAAALQSRFERGPADLHARRALELSERLGLGVLRQVALYFLAEVRAFRRERDEMERYLSLLFRLTPLERELEADAWGGCRGMLALLDDDWPGAVTALQRGMGLLADLPRANPAEFRAIWPLLLASLDDPRAPQALAEARRSDLVGALANAQLLDTAEAVLLGRAGKQAEAQELLRQADERLARFPPWNHLARLLAADPARADGWGEPDVWLREAEPVFAGLGLEPLAERCRRRLAEHPAVPDDAGISPREAEVLALVEDGLANKEIAARLRLSPRTVEKHVESLLRKTGCRSRTGLAVFGLRDAAPAARAARRRATT